jgi:hypothetical protein
MRGARSWRACAAHLARDPRVHQAAVAAAAHETTADQWHAARERFKALWRAGPMPAAPQVQPSLFDRRAIRAAEHQQRAEATRAAWRDGLRSRLTEAPVRVTTRVLAVLPLGSQGE